MEISAGQAVSHAFHAKAGLANAKIAVALASKQLDTQKTTGQAVLDLLDNAAPAKSPSAHAIDIRV